MAGTGLSTGSGLTPSFGFSPIVEADFLTLTELPDWLTFTRSGHAMMFDSTGKLTWAPNNVLLNTATLSTQNVTTIAANYVLSFKGTGTVTLSGTSTAGPLVGTGVNDRVNLAFTPTAGTLTLTVSGSVTNARLSRVTYETTMRTVDDVETTASAYYGPRLDYNPATLAARGLLIEEQRTNLCGQSQNIQTSTWDNWSSLITAVDTVSPDGTTNASTLTATGATAYVSRAVSFTVGQPYVHSCFFKNDTNRYVFTGLYDGTNDAKVIFDLQTGLRPSSPLSGTVDDWGIIDIGGGWYRCWIKCTATNTGGSLYAAQLGLSETSSSLGTPSGKVKVFGYQSELGSFPTSYIPTTTGSVTRNAETVTFASTAQTLLQGATYSAVMEFVSESSANASRLIGNGTNTASPIYRVNSTTIGAHDGTNSLSAATAVSFDSTTYRVAYGQSATGRSITSNNTAVSTGSDANYTAANVYTWSIGTYSGSEKWSGWVRGLSFYNSRLPDATLQTKSTVGGSY